jgi:ATP-binding cassette subfamily B protein
MATARYSTFTLYRRLLRQARPYCVHIVGILLLSLLSTPLALLAPLPLKIVVDSVIGNHPLPSVIAMLLPRNWSGGALLTFTAGLIVVIAILSRLLALGSLLLRTSTGERLVLSFRAMLFWHVQRLSLAYHDTKGAFDSTYRIQYNTPAIQWILIDGIVPFLNAGTMLIGIIYVTARIDRELAVVALAISPILFGLARTFAARLRDQWHQVYQLHSSAMSIVQEVLAALRVVIAFGQEEHEQRRFVQRYHKGLSAQMHVTRAEGCFSLLVGLTIALGTAAVLLIGARHVQSGALTLGELLIVMTYLTQLYGPLETLSSMVAHLQRSFSAAERAFALLDEAPDVPDRPDARPIARAAGAVAFRNVSFAYDKVTLVLRGISFEIAPGTRLGIAGKTGVGKTTLVSLLLRFHDPSSGQILLDNTDLRDYKLSNLRSQFAIVLQEPVLFSASIAENIAYARPGASRTEIIEAAQAANAHDFITQLPDGYDTQVGERGMRLAGGERQRTAIARAFLKNAPLLILDEPTSAVDTQTEAGIMEAMWRLMHGRTTFMIAHRLSTLESCDQLLVLQDGQVAAVTSDVATAIREGLVFADREQVRVPTRVATGQGKE